MNLLSNIEGTGFAIIPDVVDCATVDEVIRAVEASEQNASAGRLPGLRNPVPRVPTSRERADAVSKNTRGAVK